MLFYVKRDGSDILRGCEVLIQSQYITYYVPCLTSDVSIPACPNFKGVLDAIGNTETIDKYPQTNRKCCRWGDLRS